MGPESNWSLNEMRDIVLVEPSNPARSCVVVDNFL